MTDRVKRQLNGDQEYVAHRIWVKLSQIRCGGHKLQEALYQAVVDNDVTMRSSVHSMFKNYLIC